MSGLSLVLRFPLGRLLSRPLTAVDTGLVQYTQLDWEPKESSFPMVNKISSSSVRLQVASSLLCNAKLATY